MQPQPKEFIAPHCSGTIRILYQDDAILLIDKPTGLLSLSGKNPANKDSVHFRLVQDFPGCTLTHRLDFGTSGLMLVALNKAVNGHITKQFQNRSIEKAYEALLLGHVSESSGLIDAPIAKQPDYFPLQKVCFETGKPAISRFEVIEKTNNPEVTRVKFTPVTGRTHQLRVHSMHLGHPILGCDLYADDEAFLLGERLMLHATELSFEHPMTGARMTFRCPSPF
jgi:tRNA pseudouridine32 synthase/23S rRNA pseudouridine746 synthase